MPNNLKYAVRAILSAYLVAGVSDLVVPRVQAAPPPPGALPQRCVDGNCGNSATGDPILWVTGSQGTATVVGNTMTINQTANSALFNWKSFDVGVDSKVIFKQPSSTAIALNRIFQSSPSQIFGAVQANGQIYLINQNGFLFGSTASVNVGGLLASSLNIDADTFNAGILSAANQLKPALDGTKWVDANGQPVAPGNISVAAGAKITTNAPNGRILLAAPNVSNGGSIFAPDGQVILAGGDKLWVQASSDPKLRGLLVEVDGDGLAENQAGGSIAADRGNVTMLGLAVNQSGRVSATTSTSANGSVRLLARNSVQASRESGSGAVNIFSTQGGKLELGSQSETSVLPDPTDKSTAVDDQLQLPSTVELMGQHVVMRGGARIDAPSGQLTVVATSDPSKIHLDPQQFADSNITNDVTDVTSANVGNPQDTIRIESGAVIDLSGSTASTSVTRNLLTVELRGNEFADDPQQRNGALRGQTVVVDARVGTPIANVSGAAGLTQRDIKERTSTGGSVIFNSGGDVSIATGATVNVSGGAVNYTPGIIATSILVRADGSTVDIGSARPEDTYKGVQQPQVVVVSDRFGLVKTIPAPGIAHYDPGYVQGANAGSISILAPNMILNGKFVGTAVNGEFQRTSATMAQAGQLTLGATSAGARQQYFAPAVNFTATTPLIAFNDYTPLPGVLTLQLPTDFIEHGGFSRVQISSDSGVTLPSGVPLKLTPGGSLSLTGASVKIDADIEIPSGTISLQSATRQASAANSAGDVGLSIAAGTTLDVSGLFTNDSLLANTRPSGFNQVAGGKITLNQTLQDASLTIGSNVSFLADGGAWVQQNGAVSGGAGGSIGILSSSIANTTLKVGDDLKIEAYGVQGAKGGSFSVTAPRIVVDTKHANAIAAQSVKSDSTSGTALNVDTSLFADHGFSSFTLTANGSPLVAEQNDSAGVDDKNNLAVASTAQLNLRAETLLLNADAGKQASADSVTGLTHATLLPAYQRTNASQLSLISTLPQAAGANTRIGGLSFGVGASISADPGSSLAMSSIGSIAFDGAVNIPNGSVSVSLSTPDINYDPGYASDLQLKLGSSAIINVSGDTSRIAGTSVIYKPSDAGLLQGTVLDGGKVSLLAQRGSIVTDAGSRIDISGTQAPIDLPTLTSGFTREVVASAAGSLSVQAPESIALLGAVSASAGVGSTGTAPGGSLLIALSRGAATGFTDHGLASFAVPESIPRIVSVQAIATGQAGAQNGLAILNRKAIVGVDALTLVADNQIQFADGAQVSLGRSVTLQSPAIALSGNAAAQVSAPYVQMGSGLLSFPDLIANGGHGATAGNGTLNISADSIDVIGSLSFRGASQVSLTSAGAINLLGAQASSLNRGTDQNANSGNLDAASDLTLSAARVTPGTGVAFAISDPDHAVTFNQTAKNSGTPLSVAGSLNVSAKDIVQNGTLVAPFGGIALSATESLKLTATSLTSVSGDGAVLPYGRADSSTAWAYGLNAHDAAIVSAIPQKKIVLNSDAVIMASGAVVDVSGGGDLLSYLWTPGTGGTKDSLDASASPGLYAVLPSLLNQFAPFDPLMYENSTLKPGASIYLAGGGGLAAGVYPLLPARYALLPGAFLVSAAAGVSYVQPGAALTTADGAPIVAGNPTFGNTGLGGTLSGGFVIRPGSYAYELSDYTNVFASDFFASAARATPWSQQLPADAGALTITALSSLDAAGDVRGTPSTGGVGATIGLAARHLQINSTSAASVPGVVSIAASVLTGWKAGHLVLGGSITESGELDVQADTVVVSTNARLIADEIVLAGRQSVSLASGAAVQSTSAANNTAPSAQLTDPTALNFADSAAKGAAVLAVSDLNALVANRSSNQNGSVATVNIASNAQVGSHGALLIDAPAGADIADGTVSGAGARWSLGANQVAFGDRGVESNALVIDASLLAAINAGKSANIAAQNSIDLRQAVALGSTSGTPMDSIAWSANSISAFNGATASIAANTIALRNDGANQADASAAAGTGTLTLSGKQVQFGPGSTTLSGFGSVTAQATDAVVGVGVGNVTVSGDLNIKAPLITTQGGATTTLDASAGAVNLQASTQSAGEIEQGFGGLLAIRGQTISDQTKIVMPSGTVKLTTAQQMTLLSGAVVDVSGAKPAFAPHGSSGGTINLSAGADVSMDVNARLSVAASDGADAGRIDVDSGGNAALAGTILGGSDAGFNGGAFTVRAGTLSGFDALNRTLEKNGFNQERNFEVRSGDLNLAADSKITAHSVALIADAGSVTVGGSIDASGAVDRGFIVLAARDTVDVQGSLRANGVNDDSRGGSITLMTKTGTVNLESGATIAATGAGKTGRLVIRAPLNQAKSDINVQLSTGLSQVDAIAVEPEIAETLNSNPTTPDFAAIVADVNAQMAAGAAIKTRLNPTNAANFVVRPYIDMTYNGDLTLPALDLSANALKWRFGGQPADIAFRASGELKLTGTLSDGFRRQGTGANSFLTFTGDDSSGITLVAGADLASTAPWSTLAGSTAGLTLSDGVIVRTGSGDLLLAAAGDITLGAGSSIYTGGKFGVTTSAGVARTTTYASGNSTIRLVAGGDIEATPVIQSVTAWQPRTGTTAASWGINFNTFGWSVGALGGGDVLVNAKGAVRDFSAAVADNRFVGTVAGVTTTQAFGGGNLSVVAGGDIVSGNFYVGRGTGTILADGAITSDRIDSQKNPVGTLLSAGDASYSLRGRGDVLLQGVVQPTLLVDQNAAVKTVSYFSRYDADSALNVSSRGGAITLSSAAMASQIGDGVINDSRDAQTIAAPHLEFISYAGDVTFATPITAFPSASGQIEIAAARDVRSLGTTILALPDTDATLLHTADSVVVGPAGPLSLETYLDDLQKFHTTTLHTDDRIPVFISAGRDIDNLQFNLSKSATITAGRDVLDLRLTGENFSANDTTLVQAGRDILFRNVRQGTGSELTIGGPGHVDLIAGRDVDFGLSGGAITVGNLTNPTLPAASGADLTVLAGLGAPLGVDKNSTTATDFIGKVIKPSADYRTRLQSFVANQLGQPDIGFDDAVSAFRAMSQAQQLPLLTSVFFKELVESGREANAVPGAGFARGYAAIDALFPNSREPASSAYAGDLRLLFSRIFTLDGGSINLLVPGGTLDVGLAVANPPAYLSPNGTPVHKDASVLGIVTEKTGDVNIFAGGDVLVNSSRVFTLLGGNIAIWSTLGNIDAGRGAKSAVSAPPPVITVDPSGNVSVDVGATVAGSGIRTINTDPNVKPGNVDLIAPAGFVNAGDAGIGAAGNLNIAAQHVIGLDNIQVGGTSTGVPPATSGLGASLSGVTQSASSSTNAATSAVGAQEGPKDSNAPLAQSALSWLEVFVVGLGEETCKQDDIDCLKRQKTN